MTAEGHDPPSEGVEPPGRLPPAAPGRGGDGASRTRREICLAGTGGQGQVFASVLLAEAALHDGYTVVQTQTHGPESRGGFCKAELVLDRRRIEYPKVTCPDVLLAMSQEGYDRHIDLVAPGAFVLADASFVDCRWASQEVPLRRIPGGGTELRLPLTRLARERCGQAVVANVLALGLIAAASGIVSREGLEEALDLHVPQALLEANRRALDLGWSLGLRVARGQAIDSSLLANNLLEGSP